MIPFPKVLATALPKVIAPKTAKIINNIPDTRFVKASLPTAVENDPAKLGAPMLSAKKAAIQKIKIVILDIEHRNIFQRI